MDKNKEKEMLKALLEVATKLDYAYLHSISNSGASSFSGEEYDRLNDIMADVEEYLEKQ